MKTRNPLLVLALCCLTLSAVAQEETTATNLRPRWNQGQATHYEFWSQTLKTEAAESQGQTRSETTTYLTEGRIAWIVTEVGDEGATCTMQFETIKFTIIGNNGQQVVIDSQNRAGTFQVLEDMMAAMIATPLTVTVGADGSIESVQGVDAIAFAAGQEVVDADIIPKEIDFVETASDLATLIAAPAQATPGQTWNTQHTWNHDNVFPGAETLADWDTTYTFDSVGEIEGVPIATITTQSDIDLNVDLSELPAGRLDIDVRINDASGQGEVLFDLSRNEAVARNATMSYTAEITLSAPGQNLPPATVRVTERSSSQLLRVAEE